jgi:hypothetical protein
MAQTRGKSGTRAQRTKSSADKVKPAGRIVKDLGERSAGRIKGGMTTTTPTAPRLPTLPGGGRTIIPCI